MTVQQLFYTQPAAVSADRHRDWSVESTGDYSFAAGTNTVPLMAVEFQRAAAEYAIVFVGAGEAVTPAVILGLEQGQNLFVGSGSTWDGAYVPAFVRRYPFVFSASEDGQQFTLCIDEGFEGCNQEGRGERLFGDDGTRTPYLERVLGFLQQYQAHFQRTRVFGQRLAALDLLEPGRAALRRGASGQSSTLGGFSVVGRERLKKLSGDQLAELARDDDLELAYLHLASLPSLDRLRRRLGEDIGSAAEDSAPDT